MIQPMLRSYSASVSKAREEMSKEAASHTLPTVWIVLLQLALIQVARGKAINGETTSSIRCSQGSGRQQLSPIGRCWLAIWGSINDAVGAMAHAKADLAGRAELKVQHDRCSATEPWARLEMISARCKDRVSELSYLIVTVSDRSEICLLRPNWDLAKSEANTDTTRVLENQRASKTHSIYDGLWNGSHSGVSDAWTCPVDMLLYLDSCIPQRLSKSDRRHVHHPRLGLGLGLGLHNHGGCWHEVTVLAVD